MKHNLTKPTKIISGGQTGADIGGLFGASRLIGVRTGGTAPKGYRTEEGEKEALLKPYGLLESWSEHYPPRTEQNVLDSDITLIFGENLNSAGTKTTVRFCNKHSKPYFLYDIMCNRVEDLVSFLEGKEYKVLNIAGNRESVCPGICNKVKNIIIDLFSKGESL